MVIGAEPSAPRDGGNASHDAGRSVGRAGRDVGGGGGDRPLRIERCRLPSGTSYWRWLCRWCGEFGGGRGHPDTLGRALRHCTEHPEHPSSLVPGVLCSQRLPRPLAHLPGATRYDRLVSAQHGR